DRVIERLADPVAEGIDAAGQASETALAGGVVAGRAVDQDEAQPGILQARPQLGGRVFVGRGEFDALKAGMRGGVEAVKKRHLAEQKAEIGAEARHVWFSLQCCSLSAPFWSIGGAER